MVISKWWNSSTGKYEWVKGLTNGDETPFFAFQSQTDFDVLESGKITGLSAAGDFEIQTAFFKADDVYNEGVYLTYDGTTGNVKVAAEGDTIIGKVSGGLRGPIQLNPLDASATGGSKLTQVSDSSATAPVQMVKFFTMFNGAVAPAAP